MTVEKFRKAVEFIDPQAEKWSKQLVSAVDSLDINDEEKDTLLIYIIEKLLSKTPYPPTKIIETLGHIIIDVSRKEAVWHHDWLNPDSTDRKGQ